MAKEQLKRSKLALEEDGVIIVLVLNDQASKALAGNSGYEYLAVTVC